MLSVNIAGNGSILRLAPEGAMPHPTHSCLLKKMKAGS
jgi:hypothetical protein